MKRIGNVMQRFVISSVLCLLVLACGPLPQEQEAESAVGITAPDGYAVTCATSFIRVSPHRCMVNAVPGIGTALVADNTCRFIDVTTLSPSIPSSARVLVTRFDLMLRSNNAIAWRGANLAIYNDSSCLSVNSQFRWGIREFAAIVFSTIQVIDVVIEVPIINNGLVYYSANDDSSSSTPAMTFVPTGYYD